MPIKLIYHVIVMSITGLSNALERPPKASALILAIGIFSKVRRRRTTERKGCNAAYLRGASWATAGEKKANPAGITRTHCSAML